MLRLYGHTFSSYTWKALIALYANDTPFTFHQIGEGNADDDAFVAAAGPSGQFPVLSDGAVTVFEATSIIEHLHLHHRGPQPLLPDDPALAIRTRMWDRVFDLHVMNVMQDVVAEKIRHPDNPDLAIRERVEARLGRSYRWIEQWLTDYTRRDAVTLVECAAAPSLFYADWVHPIPDDCSQLRAWRAHLLALPAVARCVDDARPYRHYFPLGAPDRD
ncbi:glutathione S-transferase family protein [Novosphingobium aquiterrae]|uniref:Glutathione S-transferase family protein n=1 Tax=Novosphingobium aquiterrae TaxID=624388 RepID=A0ABV6PDI4_9SPHN